jgi:hypothetical protein
MELQDIGANVLRVENPKFINKEHTHVLCDLELSIWEGELLPFSVDANYDTTHGKVIWEGLKRGDYGEIADYSGPTKEQMEMVIRSKRDGLLVEIDVIVSNPLRWASFTSEEQQELATYRQDLLDVPQQSTFPDSVVWPDEPALLQTP